MNGKVKIGARMVGHGEPAFVVAEIGINHNGDLDTAKRLIDTAHLASCDAVKFQKRTPELCVPADQLKAMRETPWGYISYLEYRYRVEFGKKEYDEIARYCEERKMIWFASAWDKPSVDFLEQYSPACYKIPSALLTHHELLLYVRRTSRPLILSTGMSTMEQIRDAVKVLGTESLILDHCTSTYPCKPDELNLRTIRTLLEEFDCPIGYSGHETGLQTTYAAVVLGACFVERHITLDRATWGSDHAASVEPPGLLRLVRDIRVIERAMGDGLKRVYDSEIPVMKKLRLANRNQ